jgi:hypothetical protein
MADVLFDVWLHDEMQRQQEGQPWSYVVYEKLRPSNDAVYTGRSHGPGSATAVMGRRDARHWARNALGYDTATLNAYITVRAGKLKSAYAWAAMRGREQQVMDYHGGAILDRGGLYEPGYGGRMRASNIIRGVAKSNPVSLDYWLTSTAAFGEAWEHTGFSTTGAVAPPDTSIIAGPHHVLPLFYPY